ncbi:Putative major facilitator, sugar transporter, major facilitator superfamily [Colletotrichum destructivum]|uniref:Major facilitator, sugar transporter, major facilitator superfamily n=1 Tax=Colletotrichum destructivum TaxID=34406 RepID=A0AAX4IMG1_9PEZI|nr:Putative major facilitator, sugar transporter, major facilitator superfamily [Colletotrichum destructivum]
MGRSIEDDGAKQGVQHVERDDAVTDIIKSADHCDLERVEETQPGTFVWLCVAATAIGGMLFGYDTGVISGVLVVIGTDLEGKELTHSEKELITALTAAGALIGAVIAGITADKYGRKPAIWFASVLFTLGALIQATSYTVAQMAAGRLIIGFGVGSASMIVPLYIAEISPARFRGRMISVDMIFLGAGSVLAYAFAAAFYTTPHGWRYMVGIGGIPSIILGVLLFWCPESPRQLMFHDRREECIRVLKQIYPHGREDEIADKVVSIERGVNQSKALNEEISLRKSVTSLWTVRANLRAVIAACGLMAFQQLCGFNTLMYYSSTLFDIVGFSNPIAVGTVVAGTNFIFTVLSIFLIDRVGRRRLLLWTMWGMPVCLAIAAIAFHWIPLDNDTLKLTSQEVGWPAILVLVAMIMFVAFYAAGLGCVPWQANEFLPMEVRAMGTMMINIFNWGPNIIVSSTFLSMMRGMTPSGTFGFYAGLSFMGWVFVIFCYPEAANMTLEEIRVVFEHGFGVRYAEEWRKQRRLAIQSCKENNKV